jgi:hypothetical protein
MIPDSSIKIFNDTIKESLSVKSEEIQHGVYARIERWCVIIFTNASECYKLAQLLHVVRRPLDSRRVAVSTRKHPTNGWRNGGLQTLNKIVRDYGKFIKIYVILTQTDIVSIEYSKLWKIVSTREVNWRII